MVVLAAAEEEVAAPVLAPVQGVLVPVQEADANSILCLDNFYIE